MLRLEYQILAAIALDLLLGDPRWLPHPVRLIGAWANAVGWCLRKIIPAGRIAGAFGWLLVVGAAGGVAYGVLFLLERWDPIAYDVGAIVLLYTAIAARDLAQHAHRVYAALVSGDLVEARRRVGMIVGRDTETLDEAGVVRGAVESVAENMVDGVTAPLFFAVIGGPVAAIAYKAINTLDSMWGHKDERYLHFGWAAARIDDAANFLPARITAPLVALSAALLGFRPIGALRVFVRDGRKHPSPNSGLAEAAVAGALNVQLGGLNYYGGIPHEHAAMGDANAPLERRHIWQAIWLMLLTSFLFVALMLLCRVAAFNFIAEVSHA